MKILGLILLGFVAGAVIVVACVYLDGAMLPVDHSAMVTDVVDAPPSEVFAMITNVEDEPSWRKSVERVTLLPEDAGRDHWVEDLEHGESMTFLATQTDRLNAGDVGRREVLLNVPGASYGGTWIYEVSPGETPNQTKLSITETGFIHPPIYRFMMRHVFGITANLDQYMADMKRATGKN